MQRAQLGLISTGRRWSATLRSGAAALCVLAGTATAHAGTTFTPIVFSGDVSGLPGITVSGVSLSLGERPTIASNGDISYVALLTGEGVTTPNDSGLYVRRVGANELVLREGQTTILNPIIDFTGHIVSASAWAVTVETTSGDILFGHWANSTNTLAYAGAGGWGTHTVSNISVPSLNDAGDLAVAIRTTDGSNEWRIGRTTGDSTLFVVGESGDTISGLNGAQITSFAGFPVGIDDSGRIASFALVGNQDGQTVITASVNDQAIVTIDDSGLSLISQTNTHAPNFLTGVMLSDFGYSAALRQHVNVNNFGDVVYSSMVAGLGITGADDTALFRTSNATVSRVVRESSPAPGAGTGVTFANFPPEDLAAPIYTNANQTFFLQNLGGTGNGNGLFFGNQSGLLAIAYHGQQVVGADEGVVIEEIRAFDANNNNQAIYLARAGGPGINTTNDGVLFAFNGSEVSVLLREGDIISVNAQNRTVAEIWIDDGGSPEQNLSNGRRAINDAGDGAIAISFADGTSGIFTFDVPAPCAIPVTIPASLRAIEGTRTRFQGSATGADSVQWFANGAAISNGATYTGAATTLLSITRATAAIDGAQYTLAATNACGTIAPDPLDLTIGKRFDVNKDGLNEILWRNGSSGANLAWNVAADGQSISSSFALPSVSDINWKLAATGDFNYDGNTDLVWRNSVTGDNAVWFMNGAAFASASDLPRVSDPSWEIRSVADFNNDGLMDLLWRNRISGDNVVWLMNLSFGTIDNSIAIPTVSDPNWQIAGTGDFNADDNTDIVWRNARTGANAVWYMSGTNFSAAADISPAATDVNVRIAAIADYNNDTGPDLLMRNTLTGANELWLMNGITRSSVVTLPLVADTFWRPMGQPRFKTGQDSDFNGDGKADLFLRHATNGQNAVWFLNGPTFSSLTSLTPITDNNWVVEAVADLNRDNKTDIFWRNQATGQNVLWIMNGTTVTQSVDLPGVSNTSWHVGGVADVDGDEIADLIWNQDGTGENLAWILEGTPTDGTVVRRVTPLSTQTSPSWNLKGASDFNRDDKFDLVFRFDGVTPDTGFVTGDNEYWRLSGTTLASRVAFPNVASLSWDIRAVNDYNLDGYPDFVWRNSSTGANTIWLMRNNALGTSIALPTVSDTGWQIFR